jgi:hypothetical protein
MTRPGGLAWFGATLVWTGAAALSFAGLDGLARSCYISPVLAPLLPLVVDVGVAVAAWVWRRGVNPDAARLAGRLTWSLLVLTVLGNGAHLGMESSHILPPWWVAAAVGAIPPAVAGATAHLLVLLGRTDVPTVSPSAEGSDGPQAATGAVVPPAVPVAPKQDSTPAGTDSSTKRSAGAVRVERSRKHKAGDHSICLPGNCPEAPVNGAEIRDAVMA